MAIQETASIPDMMEAELASALAWWNDAGVDCDFAPDATTWLAAKGDAAMPPPPAALRKKAALPPQTPIERLRAKKTVSNIVGDDADNPADGTSPLPNSLEAFGEWWLTEPALSLGSGNARLAPRGAAGADLMVIVPSPEDGDTDRLLNGADGRMLDAVMSAIGIAPDAAYIASALPCVVPAIDWGMVGEAGFGKILARHIELVKPKRVLVLGANIPPLIAHITAHQGRDLTQIVHEGGNTPIMLARTIANLRNLPGERSRFWRKWLQWTDK